jgi:hypothetical protein
MGIPENLFMSRNFVSCRGNPDAMTQMPPDRLAREEKMPIWILGFFLRGGRFYE